MKNLILISLVVLAGCAHETIHEKCLNPEIVSHYKDYDQCYAEQSARKERIQRAFAQFGAKPPQTSQTCHTTNSVGDRVYLSCN